MTYPNRTPIWLVSGSNWYRGREHEVLHAPEAATGKNGTFLDYRISST
jgi:hypothetical protein